MVALTHPNLKHWIAPAGGAVAGGIVAIVALAMPTPTLEGLVANSGIAALIPVAQPPLGNTARALLAVGGGVLAAAIVWSALYLLFGPGGTFESLLDPSVKSRRSRATKPQKANRAIADETSALDDDDDRVPTLRRADAHPDAPARRPLSARDLGAPMPPVEPVEAVQPEPVEVVRTPPVVQDLPADLDQPLARFDPDAVLASPREPVRPVTPLRAPALAQGERIDSVELPRSTPTEDMPSIESLLRRLEQGARRQRAVSR